MKGTGMPSSGETLKIIESSPPKECDSENIKAISIDIDKENFRAKPLFKEINELLQKIPNPEKIVRFDTGYDSKLTRIPCLNRFNNIEYVGLGSAIKSYEEVHRIKNIRTLFLVNYKHADLSDFQKLDLEHIRLIRGRVERLNIKSRSALLQSCSKLRSLRGFDCKILDLWTCNQIDLTTLSEVMSLEVLSLRGCKCVDNLEFISNCRNMKHLEITATKNRNLDFSLLKKTQSLETFFLDINKKSIVKAVADNNTDVIISNGDTTFWKGAIQDQGLYYDTREEYFTKSGGYN